MNNRDNGRDTLERYLQEIAGYEPLKSGEEVELAKKIRKGIPGAMDKLVKANLKFVISVAKEYQGQGLPLQDLISEGNMGLIKAATRFDETRGFKFISYAVWWIRQCILQALAEQSRVVRLPLNRVTLISKLRKARKKITKQTGRDATIEEIADKTDMTVPEAEEVIISSQSHRSLDEPFKNADDESLLALLKNTQRPSPDSDLMDESLRIEVEKVLSTIKPREADIIRLYFGFHPDFDRNLTLEEIGELYELTRERVRQIKEKALERLRHKSRLEPLRQYLG